MDNNDIYFKNMGAYGFFYSRTITPNLDSKCAALVIMRPNYANRPTRACIEFVSYFNLIDKNYYPQNFEISYIGVLHRLDGPAISYEKYNPLTYKYWYKGIGFKAKYEWFCVMTPEDKAVAIWTIHEGS